MEGGCRPSWVDVGLSMHILSLTPFLCSVPVLGPVASCLPSLFLDPNPQNGAGFSARASQLTWIKAFRGEEKQPRRKSYAKPNLEFEIFLKSPPVFLAQFTWGCLTQFLYIILYHTTIICKARELTRHVKVYTANPSRQRPNRTWFSSF